MYGIIYRAINKVNGLSYVGQTTGELKQRIGGHVSSAFTSQSDLYFHRALRKYGLEYFDWHIIDEADSLTELNRLEMEWIEMLGTYGSNGYNSTYGGDSVKVEEVSRITRERMSLSRGGRPFLIFDLHGNYEGKELIQNEFAINNGILVPNVCSVLNGRKNSIGGYILIFEDEFTLELLASRLKRTRGVRKFEAINVKTSQIIGTYTNQKDCAESLGIKVGNVGNVLRGRTKSSRGYTFRYTA